jgi:hypothetical protein
MSAGFLKSESWPLTLRIAVGAHIAAVCVCALFSILDSSALNSSSVGLPLEDSLGRIALGLAFFAALLAGLISPLTVLTVTLRRGLSRETACALLAEIVTCLAQAYAMLPLVQ